MAQAEKIVPADDLPDNLVPASDLPDELAGGSTQADYTIDAKVGGQATRPPEGFFGTLESNVSQGASSIKDALLPTSDSLVARQPAFMLGKAALGAMQIMGAPVSATGRKFGEIAQDVSMALGIGPNVSAGIATAADMGISLAGIPKAISAAAPYAMKGVQSAAKALPGAQTALREMGKKIVDAFPSALKPAVPSDNLYRMVDELNPTVTLPGFQSKAKEILKTESQLAEFGLANTQLSSAAGKAAKATSKVIDPATKWLGDEFGMEVATAPRDLPFKVVQRIRQRLGERIGELRVSGGEELGSYKQLYKTLTHDLENVADTEAGQAFKFLKKANAAANREFAIGELDDIFNATMGRALEGREITSSNFAQALNKIRDLRRSDELFAKGIGAKNLDKIEKQLDELRQLKINPPPKGVNVGSALVMGRATVAGGIGGAIGGITSGPGGAAIGASIGSALGAGVPWAISRIMQSPRAADWLIRTLKKDGTLSAEKLSALVAIVRGEEARTREFEQNFQAAMKDRDESIESKIERALDRDKLKKEVSAAEMQLSIQ